MAGQFITVEGGEGVGKSTFIASLCAWLEKHKPESVVRTFEPGGTKLANLYREIFVSQSEEETMYVETEFLTVAAARAQHVRHLILPALKEGKWVVCDRYVDSSRAYQGCLGGVPLETIDQINNFATGGCMPAMTLLLDCDVDTAMQRTGKREVETNAKKSRFDAKPKAYHEKLRAAFLQLAEKEPGRFSILDASQSPERVLEQAKNILKARGWL